MTGTMRREVAILFGDVVGYSRLMDLDEDRTYQRLRDCLVDHWRPLIKEFGGRIVGTGGDSMFAEFADAGTATRCATALQTRMRDVNADLADGDRFVLRIGVNFGEVLDTGDDLYGAVVNVAARLQALTEPGGVLVSEAVRIRLPDDLAAQFTEAGQKRLKNIANPVPVHRWRRGATDEVAPAPFMARVANGAAQAAGGMRSLLGKVLSRRTKPAEDAPVEDEQTTPGIIVMPFSVLGQDSEDQVLADGMTEEIITILGQQANLRTLARGDSFAHRTDGASAGDMRRQYGVGYVLEGSTRQAREEFLCTVRLIEAASDRVLWTQRYQRPLADVFDVQVDIAERVAFAIQSAVVREEGFRIRSRPPDNLQAWQLVVRANHELFARMNSTSLANAERLLRLAVETDPDYADAWALLALTLAGKVAGGYSKDPEREDAEAISLAEAALDMAPNDATVLGAVAATKAHLGNGGEGLRLINRALEMAPHYAPFHQTKAVSLSQNSQHAEAIPILERIVDASPQDLQRHMNMFILAIAYASEGRRSEARAAVEKAIELDPTWHQPHMFEAMLYGMQGRFSAAAAKVADARRLEPDLELEGYVYFFKKSRAPLVKPLLMMVRKLWKDSDKLLAAG